MRDIPPHITGPKQEDIQTAQHYAVVIVVNNLPLANFLMLSFFNFLEKEETVREVLNHVSEGVSRPFKVCCFWKM